MSDNDLIRRGDALALPPYDGDGDPAGMFDHHIFAKLSDLRAIPAVQVTVRPLEWQHEARNGWKVGVAWATGYHVIRHDDGWHYGNGTGGVFPTIEAAKASAQADYEACIRSTLTDTPAPDAAKVAEVFLAFENVDSQLDDEGEFTERAWEQLRAAIAAMKEAPK